MQCRDLKESTDLKHPTYEASNQDDLHATHFGAPLMTLGETSWTPHETQVQQGSCQLSPPAFTLRSRKVIGFRQRSQLGPLPSFDKTGSMSALAGRTGLGRWKAAGFSGEGSGLLRGKDDEAGLGGLQGCVAWSGVHRAVGATTGSGSGAHYTKLVRRRLI